jgi:trehalose 2-sulfotransferase
VGDGLYSDHRFSQEYPSAGPPRVSFLVCALPRSGSSLLCELLARTELAGAPAEFFEPNQRRRLEGQWDAGTLDRYVGEMLARKTTPNGVFGLKALYHQLVDAVGLTSPRDLFPNVRYVYIKRHDHVRQAVSFARAIQTDQWASEHPAGRADPVFDAAQIGELIAWIRSEEALWEEFFRREGSPVLRLLYEDFAESIDETLARVLRFLAVDVPAGFQPPRPTLSKQADDLTERWVRDYLSLDASSQAGS